MFRRFIKHPGKWTVSRPAPTLFLLFVTTIFTGFGDVIFYKTMNYAHTDSSGQLEIMRGQLTQTELEQRPWVYADIELADAIKFTGHTMYVTLKFTLHNTGHTPALYVWPELHIYSSTGKTFDSLYNAQTNMCGELRRRPNGSNTTGLPLFPGQTITIPIIVTMDNSEVDADLAAWPDSEVSRKLGFPPFISPVIAGCIDYQPTSKAEHYQTGFMYNISSSTTDQMKKKRLLLGAGFHVPVTEDPIPLKNLSLTPFLIQGRSFFAN